MLYDRLKQIRQSSTRVGDAGPGDSARHEDAALEQQPGDRRSESCSPGADWKEVAPLVFRRSVFAEDPAAAKLHRFFAERVDASIGLIPERVGPDSLIFFDLETTGLSSGAGSVAFLAGLGRLSSSGLTVEQLFLADYPGEPEFLLQLRHMIPDQAVLVSYNGRSFDAQVLKTRLLMNGMQELPVRHADLLHPARRLWKRLLPDCSLGTVEEGVLQLNRALDIPGWEVPEAYFEYLRSGRRDRLTAVLAHHEQDIRSLALLLWYMEAFGSGEDPTSRVDRFELGRLLTREECALGVRSQGRKVLHDLLSPNHPDALRAALHLANLYRRAGDLASAETVWSFAFEELRSVEASIALAKLQEHVERDISAALDIVQTALAWPHARPHLEELRYRFDRLERKRARRGIAPSRRN
jgi:uncharacterized protein